MKAMAHHPLEPMNGVLVIVVSYGSAYVARYRERKPGTGPGKVLRYDIERAHNWADLEQSARYEVMSLGALIERDGHYPCPEYLARRAAWNGPLFDKPEWRPL
jgi:hypothetical protein